MNQILSQSLKLCKRYYKNTLVSVFFLDTFCDFVYYNATLPFYMYVVYTLFVY